MENSKKKGSKGEKSKLLIWDIDFLLLLVIFFF